MSVWTCLWVEGIDTSSTDECVYRNNLWRDVNPSQEKTFLFDRCNISKHLCVSVHCVLLSFCTLSLRQRGSLYTLSVWICVNVNRFLLCFSLFGLINPLKYSFAWLIPDSSSLVFSLFCLPRTLVYLCFFNLVLWLRLCLHIYCFLSSRFEIKVVLCKDKLTKLASTWIPDISTMSTFIIP